MRVNKNIFIYEYGMAVPYNYEPYEEVMFEDMKFYKQLGLLGRKEEMIYPDASFAAIPSLKNDPWKSTLSMGSKWQFWHLLGRAAFNPDRDAAKEIAEAERLF